MDTKRIRVELDSVWKRYRMKIDKDHDLILHKPYYINVDLEAVTRIQPTAKTILIWFNNGWIRVARDTTDLEVVIHNLDGE